MASNMLFDSTDKAVPCLIEGVAILALLHEAVVEGHEQAAKMNQLMEERAGYEDKIAALEAKCSELRAKLQAAEANCQADADNSATLSKVHKEEESAKEAATNALKSQQFSNLLVQANLRAQLEAEHAARVSAAACVTGLEERLRAQLVELEAAAAEVAIASSISSSLKQQVKSMAADLELQRSNAASAASMLADVQQQLQVVETAFYMRQKTSLSWAQEADMVQAQSRAEELEGQLEQLKLAAQQQQVVEQSRAARAASKVADLQQQVQVLETALYAKEEMSLTWAEHADLAEALGKVQQLEAELQQAKEAAAQADTALSMARALQCEVQFWRCRSTLQRTHGNSTQRGAGSTWAQLRT